MVPAEHVPSGMDHGQRPAGAYAGRTAAETSTFTKSTTGIRPPSKRPMPRHFQKGEDHADSQQTSRFGASGHPAWCFAAVEQMVPAYYGLPAATQYEIARRNTEALATVDPQVQERWSWRRFWINPPALMNRAAPMRTAMSSSWFPASGTLSITPRRAATSSTA
ncbi:hypothetical protein [Agrobacterium leguminum]